MKVKITYEEFQRWKARKYSIDYLKKVIFSKYLDEETINNIDDIDHNWGLTFDLYFLEKELNKNENM